MTSTNEVRETTRDLLWYTSLVRSSLALDSLALVTGVAESSGCHIGIVSLESLRTTLPKQDSGLLVLYRTTILCQSLQTTNLQARILHQQSSRNISEEGNTSQLFLTKQDPKQYVLHPILIPMTPSRLECCLDLT